MTAPVRPGGTAPHVVVDDVDRPVLSEPDFHHLARVRRLRAGDPVSVTDGRGSWRWCEFDTGELRVVTDVVTDPEPTPRLLIGFALVKGEKPELVVQKLTEIGVDDIVLFIAERSVVKWDGAKAEKNLERLKVVAREASMQSRRTWLPTVHPVRQFAEVAVTGSVRADLGGAALDATVTSVLIGPEGGWSEAERSTLPAIDLGENVLRAETAAIVAAVRLVALRGATR